MKTLSLKNLSELPSAAKTILDFAKDSRLHRDAKPKKIFCFYGELGAGKTTLIKEICKRLGVVDKGSSPTFSLINEYRTAAPTLRGEGKDNSSLVGGQTAPFRAGGIVFHFDLYRLKSESEIYDIGYEDYLFSGNYCFIEWPEKMERLLPKDVVRIRIEVNASERAISIEV